MNLTMYSWIVPTLVNNNLCYLGILKGSPEGLLLCRYQLNQLIKALDHGS